MGINPSIISKRARESVAKQKTWQVARQLPPIKSVPILIRDKWVKGNKQHVKGNKHSLKGNKPLVKGIKHHVNGNKHTIKGNKPKDHI